MVVSACAPQSGARPLARELAAQWRRRNQPAHALRIDGATPAALGRAGVAAATVLAGHEVLAALRTGPGHAMAAAPDGSLVKGYPSQARRPPFAIPGTAPAVGRDSEAVLARALDGRPASTQAVAD